MLLRQVRSAKQHAHALRVLHELGDPDLTFAPHINGRSSLLAEQRRRQLIEHHQVSGVDPCVRSCVRDNGEVAGGGVEKEKAVEAARSEHCVVPSATSQHPRAPPYERPRTPTPQAELQRVREAQQQEEAQDPLLQPQDQSKAPSWAAHPQGPSLSTALPPPFELDVGARLSAEASVLAERRLQQVHSQAKAFNPQMTRTYTEKKRP